VRSNLSAIIYFFLLAAIFCKPALDKDTKADRINNFINN